MSDLEFPSFFTFFVLRGLPIFFIALGVVFTPSCLFYARLSHYLYLALFPLGKLLAAQFTEHTRPGDGRPPMASFKHSLKQNIKSPIPFSCRPQ